jgi:hypothetical protein
MLPNDLVWNGVPGERNLGQPAPRGVNGFAHGLRHFVGLARREANATLTVANRDEGIEREAPTTLHDLGHAVDRDDVLDEIATLARTLVWAT